MVQITTHAVQITSRNHGCPCKYCKYYYFTTITFLYSCVKTSKQIYKTS